jgi:hypothetical protein
MNPWLDPAHEETQLAKYLLEINYTLDGLRGVMSEGGSARLVSPLTEERRRRCQMLARIDTAKLRPVIQ